MQRAAVTRTETEHTNILIVFNVTSRQKNEV